VRLSDRVPCFVASSSAIRAVDGEVYCWHLKVDVEWCLRWIYVSRADFIGQLLCLDPSHAKFKIGPKAVAEAIRFAKAHGYQPGQRCKPMRLTSDGNTFTVLSDDWSQTQHFRKTNEPTA